MMIKNLLCWRLSLQQSRLRMLLHPTQTNTSALGFYLLDLYIDDVTDFEDGAVRDLALMQKAILLDADVYESAEVHYVADGAFELHACQQVFGFEYVRAQDGSGGVGARVTAWADELFEDVFECGHAAFEFGG